VHWRYNGHICRGEAAQTVQSVFHSDVLKELLSRFSPLSFLLKKLFSPLEVRFDSSTSRLPIDITSN
jgi:hypothetical protein